jgi:predicted PurR-regulated permease PerM
VAPTEEDEVARARKKSQGPVKEATPAPPPSTVSAPLLPPGPQPQASTLRPLVVDERVVAWALGLGVTVAVLSAISSVLLPLLFVGVATFVGAPFVDALHRRGLARSVGSGVVVAGALVLLAGLLALVVPTLITDLVALFERAPAALSAMASWIEKTFSVTIPTSVRDLSGLAASEVLAQLSPVAQTGGAIVKLGVAAVSQGAASALGFVGQAALVPIIAYFVLSELPEVKSFVWAIWPDRARGIALRYGPLIDDALTGLVRGQVTVAAIMAVLYAIGLFISGVPLTLAIAVLSGAAYLIPFASAAVCLLLAVTFSLLELGTSAVVPIVGATVTAGVVQLVEGYWLTPRIVGEKAGLSPLATLLAVLCGGSAAGFLGVLFALPVGAVAAIVVKDLAARASVPSAEPPRVTA